MLKNKVVVITGSGRGIGAACAIGAARQGARLVINDIDADEVAATVTKIKSLGGDAIGCVADVSDWNQARTLVEECLGYYGRIDGLVNNAAIYHRARIDEFDPEISKTLVNVNVLGPMYCTAHAIKPMLKQKSGSIINVVSGAHMGMATMGVYGATKGAVASMTYTWAIELEGTGVRVNGLSPFGATRMGTPTAEELKDPAIKKMAAEIQPAEANSPVVEFLLSDRAHNINGQLVRIDKEELQLYTHPALLVPPAIHSTWTAETVAEAFEKDLAHRQVRCGVMAATALPVEIGSGFWKRVDE